MRLPPHIADAGVGLLVWTALGIVLANRRPYRIPRAIVHSRGSTR